MLLGIDATNWVHQLWHAHSGHGVLGHAVSRLEALVEHVQPSHVVACFDRRSFRHDLAEDYKATRKQRDASLFCDLAEAPAAFGRLCTIAAEDGFEADDCLATLAKIGRDRGEKTILASPDKDLRQCLVDGRVTILRQFATEAGKLKKLECLTARDLWDVYGLLPAQWPDYQALVGDTGDNVQGCKGWGEKTACAALAKAGSLTALLANPWAVKVTDKQRDSLVAFGKRADLVLQLVTLRTDVAAVWDALR